MPAISIVIPCYNAAKFIRETLESVLAQSVRSMEVLVVDDGSKDDSAAIADWFGAPVRVIRQTNAGECAARNRGLDEARGEWVAFLDADDVWRPTKLEKQVAALGATQNAVCVHTRFFYFGSRDDISWVPQDVVRENYSLETLLLNPLVNTSTAMIRNGLGLRFPEGVRQGGDMIFFAQLCDHGRFVYVNEPLAGYRAHPGQVTREADSAVKNFENRFRWVDSKAALLGPQRHSALVCLLRTQVVEWINKARWERRWELYWKLRAYADTFEWGAERPTVLNERLYPRVLYRIKDAWDGWRQPNKSVSVPSFGA